MRASAELSACGITGNPAYSRTLAFAALKE